MVHLLQVVLQGLNVALYGAVLAHKIVPDAGKEESGRGGNGDRHAVRHADRRSLLGW